MEGKEGNKVRDVRGRGLRIGDYVLIQKAPDYPGVLEGDLGRLVGDQYFLSDGSVNVDVCSINEEEDHMVNLNFSPTELRRIDERTLIRSRIPKSFNPDRILKQYVAISNYRCD